MADVGVVVGRFQIHDLHPGHKSLLDHVDANHHKLTSPMTKVMGFLDRSKSFLLHRQVPLPLGTLVLPRLHRLMPPARRPTC